MNRPMVPRIFFLNMETQKYFRNMIFQTEDKIKTFSTFRTKFCYHFKVSMFTITIEWNGEGVTIGFNGFLWFWGQATIGLHGFYWSSTIGSTIKWLQTRKKYIFLRI